MRVDRFDFSLPEELIALRPARPRDSARLLEVGRGGLVDRQVRDLPGLLRPGDLCLFNDTWVIKAQLTGRRLARAGGDAVAEPKIDVTLHKRLKAEAWLAFARPGRKLSIGDRLAFAGLTAEVQGKGEGGEVLLVFDRAGAALDAALAAEGAMPLPPYIASRRKADEADGEDYQTVFARREGSVAAPTAGLHFTPELLGALAAKGILRADVTLHVGAGTFLPVKAEDTSAHKMHSERGEVSEAAAEAINRAKAAGGRLVAIGTTALRLVETAAGPGGEVYPFSGETDIFIQPGYRFRAVDCLWTNFHLPRSTLFMLVCAFAGTEAMKAAYAHAIEKKYRFYSYGDASFLTRAAP